MSLTTEGNTFLSVDDKMPPKKGNAKANASKTARAKVKLHKCDKCSKAYKTVSALNNHKRIQHCDIRWRCPFCDKDQVSKNKHNLHIQRKHPHEWKPNMSLDQNQIKMNKMTDKAKDAMLRSLQKTINKQLQINTRYKTSLVVARTKLLATRTKLKAANQKLEQLNHTGFPISEDESDSEDTSDESDESTESDEPGHSDESEEVP